MAGAPWLSVSVALGNPVLGPAPFCARAPQGPYEDATSTEPKRLLSNGSPPFRGYLPWRDPTLPLPLAARAWGSARCNAARANDSLIMLRTANVLNGYRPTALLGCPNALLGSRFSLSVEHQHLERPGQHRRPGLWSLGRRRRRVAEM